MARSSAFVASALPATGRVARAPAVCMGAPPPEAVTRRAALAALAAAVVGVGGASSATAGPAASQSFFGYGGASSPYSYADKSTGSVLYKDLNDEEVGKYRAIYQASRQDLSETAVAAIAGKSWEDVRSALRLRANDLGAAAKRLSDASSSAKAANKAYDQFKASANRLDWAARQKDQAKATAAREAASADLDKWGQVVGLF